MTAPAMSTTLRARSPQPETTKIGFILLRVDPCLATEPGIGPHGVDARGDGSDGF
jgi:hypothetical protein